MSYAFFDYYEDKLRTICETEHFRYAQRPIGIIGIGLGVVVDVAARQDNACYGIRYELVCSLISQKTQLRRCGFLLNGKPASDVPEPFKGRLQSIDACVRQLFPDEPVILSVPA